MPNNEFIVFRLPSALKKKIFSKYENVSRELRIIVAEMVKDCPN